MKPLVTAVALLLALSLAPVGAVVPTIPLGVGNPTGLIASDNVTWTGTIPNPGVIGARFRDGIMYVTGAHGLVTYDVSDQAHPVEIGRLALPHFQNEDVDLGGDILLISTDALTHTGILYVVDISDPADPSLLSSTWMGGNPLTGGPGHTASCVLDCRFAWIADMDGIRVFDLTDPSAPVDKGRHDSPVGEGLVTHDVQRDENGLYWVAGWNGTAAYRVPDDYDGGGLGELVAMTNEEGRSTYLDEFGMGDGSSYNDYVHHNSMRREDSDVVWIVEEDYMRPGCRGAGSFQRWRLPMAEDPDSGEMVITGEDLEPIDQWVPELLADTAAPAAVCSAHYFDERDGLVAHAWYQQGLRFLDVTGEEIRQVGYFITPETVAFSAYYPDTDASGEIVYLLNGARGIDVVHIDRGGGVEELPAVTAPILTEWVGTSAQLAPHPAFGYACALLVR